MSVVRRIVVPAFVAAFAAAPSLASPAPATPSLAAASWSLPSSPMSTLRGHVTDASTGAPIVDALILLRGSPHRSLTDPDGRFVFEAVEAGYYVLDVEHIAYAARSDTIAVGPGSDLSLEVTLAQTAIALKPIEVVARPRKLVLVGFFDRQEAGIGTYFTREDIEESRIQRVSDLLSRVPGLRRTLTQDGRSQISMRGVKSITQDCSTQYFIDGVQAEIGPLGVDIIPARDVAGIEIYRGSSELPIQFDVGRAGCGAILIWTRTGS